MLLNQMNAVSLHSAPDVCCRAAAQRHARGCAGRKRQVTSSGGPISLVHRSCLGALAPQPSSALRLSQGWRHAPLITSRWRHAPAGQHRTATALASAAGGSIPERSTQEQMSNFLTSLFPLWVILAAISGYHEPALFNWFTPQLINSGLMFVMLGMGLTLTFKEMASVFTKQPILLALGMVLQYTVLPAIGYGISRYWGLEPGLAIGVALVSCMPGGTASNIIAYIARGDMPLSVMMTSASTLLAVFMTPMLATLLVGQLVPVDPKAMFLSVLQLVLAPVMVGCSINTVAPKFVALVRPFMPLVATAVVVLIVGSLVSCNVAIVGAFGPLVLPPVIVLHSCGFGLGYWISKGIGQSDKIARTNSIEVGMQSSALAAVLARIHFPGQPMVVAACVISACTMSLMGSLLAGVWSITVQNFDS